MEASSLAWCRCPSSMLARCPKNCWQTHSPDAGRTSWPVACRAASIDPVLGDGGVLEASAWVHDVGYAPALGKTGFHPLDGARYLRDIGAPSRIVGLVAFHSSAASEAQAFGVADDLVLQG